MKIRIGPQRMLVFEEMIPLVRQYGTLPNDQVDQLLCVCFRQCDAAEIQKAMEQFHDRTEK